LTGDLGAPEVHILEDASAHEQALPDLDAVHGQRSEHGVLKRQPAVDPKASQVDRSFEAASLEPKLTVQPTVGQIHWVWEASPD
jgi:hypothetical protein